MTIMNEDSNTSTNDKNATITDHRYQGHHEEEKQTTDSQTKMITKFALISKAR